MCRKGLSVAASQSLQFTKSSKTISQYGFTVLQLTIRYSLTLRRIFRYSNGLRCGALRDQRLQYNRPCVPGAAGRDIRISRMMITMTIRKPKGDGTNIVKGDGTNNERRPDQKATVI